MTFTSISDLYFVSVGLLGLNILFDVLVDTGLIYLPFAMVIIESLFKGFSSSKSMSDSAFALKTMETRCYAMLIVMIVAFIPVIPYTLDSTASFERMCRVTGEVATVEQQGSDLEVSGSALAVSGYDLRVPALVNYALNLGNGVAVEGVNRLPCSINILGMLDVLKSKKIQSRELAMETKEFLYQCYQPARSLALQNMDTTAPWIADPNVVGADKSWPGHSFFMNSNYYGNVGRGFYAKTPMQGWQSSPNNANYYAYADLDASQQATHGYPTCLEWWQGVGSGFSGVFNGNDQSVGLRARLLDDMGDYQNSSDRTWWEDFQTTVSTRYGANEDEQLRLALFDTYDIEELQQIETKDYADETEGTGSSMLATVGRFMGTVGNIAHSVTNLASQSMIQMAAPIIKSALLFVLLVPFPLAMIVSKFSMKFAVEYCFFLFGVMMCPFFWDIAMLAQQSFIDEILLGEQSFTTNEGLTSSAMGAVEGIANANVALLGTYIGDALFILFPTVVIGMFTAAGMQIGNNLQSATGGMEKQGQQAGNNGGSGVQKSRNLAKKADGAAAQAAKR